jgi:glycogen(starch) synthase
MKGEVQYALHAPWDKVDVIANGVHAEKFDFDFTADEASAFRTKYAAPNEKLIFFVGRGTHEKGAHVLIGALPKIRAQYHDAKIIIVGGGNKDHLIRQAHDLGITQHVYFTGFIPDDTLLRLYKVIDVAVYPSLYEPFGIVALEAMAAGVPVVVADAGGLREIVEHDVTGTVTWSGNNDSLAWGITRVLKDPENSKRMADNAKVVVKDLYNWDRIAAQTQEVYQRVWTEYKASNW